MVCLWWQKNHFDLQYVNLVFGRYRRKGGIYGKQRKTLDERIQNCITKEDEMLKKLKLSKAMQHSTVSNTTEGQMRGRHFAIPFVGKRRRAHL